MYSFVVSISSKYWVIVFFSITLLYIIFEDIKIDFRDAKLLILDEPTSGLDAATRNEFLEILQDYIQDGEKSVLFSTHVTADLEKVADYITYLEKGKLMYTGSMEELLQKYVIIKGAPKELTEDLKKHILGIRKTNMGFEGLILTKTARQYKEKYLLNTPTIDEIMIHISKEGL